MYKLRSTIPLAALLLTVSVTSSIAADIVYVSSKQANVYREARLDSNLLATLQRSDAMEVLNREGVWVQIKAAVITGWVSRYSVSTVKPFEQKVSIFSRLKNFFRADNKRARLTLISTAGGIRGLTEEESDALGKTDFTALQSIETLAVSEADIDKFIAETTD